MRRTLLLLACLLTLSGPARADYLELYAETAYGSCQEAPLGETRVHLYHTTTTGSIASRFTIDVTGAPGTTLLFFESQFGNIGPLGGEQWVGYGTCQTGIVEVGRIYMVTACGLLRIGPATAFDCSQTETAAGASCTLCVFCAENPVCYPSATQPSTWGSVKALYR
jgi:hypothetical protein